MAQRAFLLRPSRVPSKITAITCEQTRSCKFQQKSGRMIHVCSINKIYMLHGRMRWDRHR